MKKLTSTNLDEMRSKLVLLDESAQRGIIGGVECKHGVDMNIMCPECNGMSVVSWESYLALDELGRWEGGWYRNPDNTLSYAPPSSFSDGFDKEEITGFCKEHGLFFGDECYGIHVGHGDEYCDFHHYWYDEHNGCNSCNAEAITGYCAEHDVTWKIENEATDVCPECPPGNGDSEAPTGYCPEHDLTWKNENGGTDVCPECDPGHGGSGHAGNGDSSDYPTFEQWTDGVDVDDESHFTFGVEGYAMFEEQLKGILSSNSVLKNILSRFDNGSAHLTFRIGDLVDAQAQTTFLDNKSFSITFDRKYIDEEGWNAILKEDNVGYDWSKVQNLNEALVVAVTHESLHAKHLAIYKEAQKIGKYSIEQSAQYLLDQNYSQDFVNIFYHQNDLGYWNYNKQADQEKNMEKYIKDHDHGVIDAAVKEYRDEFKIK